MTLAMTVPYCQRSVWRWNDARTVESNHGEDEDNGEGHDHDRVDLQSGRLISVKPCESMSA